MKLSVIHGWSSIQVRLDKDLIFEGKLNKKLCKKIWYLKDKSKELIATFTVVSTFFDKFLIMSIVSGNKEILVNYFDDKPHIETVINDKDICIIFHHDNKASLFIGDRQVGIIKKFYYNFINAEYLLIGEKELTSDLLKLIVIASLIINEKINADEYTVVYESFKELKQFDHSWYPKNP